MPTLLTFGDSNTYGTAPIAQRGVQQPRIAQRWPVVCGEALGWDIVPEGLPGRTVARPCPVSGPHMDGRIGLFIALESHGPIDALAIMLGTNDFKAHFDIDAQTIAEDAGFLLDVALSEEMQTRHGGFEPFLIAPPTPFEAGEFAEDFKGVNEKASKLAAAYAEVAKARDVAFLDASTVIDCSPLDGIHFDETAHIALGKAVAALVKSEIET